MTMTMTMTITMTITSARTRRLGRRAALVLWLAAGAGACAGEAGESGGGGNPDGGAEDGLPRQLIRLDLAEQDGQLSVRNIEPITIGDDAAPPSPMVDGEYVVVTYAGDEILEASFVAFPRVMVIEPGAAASTGATTVALADRMLGATVYLTDDQTIDSLEILDATGGQVLALDGGDIPHAEAAGRIGSLTRGLSSGLAGTPYAHIKVLEAGDRWYLPLSFQDDTWEIFTPSAEQISILRDGFDRTPSDVRGAVATVAFVDPTALSEWINGEWAGIAIGNTFLLNAATDANWLRGTVVHESAHNYTYLMASQSGTLGLPSTRWSAEVIAKADERLRRFGVRASLRGGMVDAWRALQRSAVDLGLAVDYQGSAWSDFPQDSVAANGFASRYGSSEAYEDIAEHVLALQAPEYHEGPHPLCQRLMTGAEMEPAMALGYAKLVFLHGLGFITDAAMDACAAGFLPTGADGIHLYRDDNQGGVHFTEEPNAGYFDDNGTQMLGMLASGGAYGALLQVNPDGGTGLGLHRLDTIGLWNVGESGLDAFYLSNSENYALARGSDSGLAVFTQVSSERVEGLILYLNLRNAFGDITDTFSWGTFRYTP